IISSMHPTSAVGGMPFNKVQKFIFSNEGLRSDYASAIGVLSKDKQELCVGLRSCSLKDINLELYVGAGIVKGSSPEDEYIELLNKSQGLLRSLEVVKI
ncbi:MAG: chorismate-binding protein, partial [Psittacicella sp.]